MPTDPSILFQQKTIADYMAENEDRQLKKQLMQNKASSSGGATMAIAQTLMDQGIDPVSAISIAKSGLGQGVTYQSGVGVTPMQGTLGSLFATENSKAQGRQQAEFDYAGPIESQKLGTQLQYEPMIEAEKARQKAAVDTETSRNTESLSNEKVLPIIDELKLLNERSPSIAYAGKTQFFRRLAPGTSPAESAVDLMKQARLDLAAPLAKQLGVNPTDKDFQASLDRIFDIEASKESRQAQINALEQRIKTRQQQLRGPSFQDDPLEAARRAIDARNRQGFYNPNQTLPDAAIPIQNDIRAQLKALGMTDQEIDERIRQ